MSSNNLIIIHDFMQWLEKVFINNCNVKVSYRFRIIHKVPWSNKLYIWINRLFHDQRLTFFERNTNQSISGDRTIDFGLNFQGNRDPSIDCHLNEKPILKVSSWKQSIVPPFQSIIPFKSLIFLLFKRCDLNENHTWMFKKYRLV